MSGSSAARDARHLARVIEGIVDREVAVGFLRHELARLGPAASAAVIAEIDARAEARDAAAARVVLLLSVALASRECAAMREAIAEAARERGDVDTARRLTAGPGARALEDDSPQVPDFGRGRAITLGERKSLARRRDRDLLARVLRDPHPDVIRIVLSNPALTEADVVRLCAKRPITPEVLREVARSARWMVRYGVRLALARNPYTPLDVALSTVPHLNAQDAREIAASPELHDRLREACERLVRPRTLH